jgi:hypothetical protein
VKEKFNWDSWQVSIGLYLAWFVTSLLAVFSGLYIREVIIRIVSLFQVAAEQAYQQKGGIGWDFTPGRVAFLLDNIMLFVIGIAVVGFAIWIEYYFRKGRPQGLLLKRIGKVAGVEVAIILVSILFLLVVV